MSRVSKINYLSWKGRIKCRLNVLFVLEIRSFICNNRLFFQNDWRLKLLCNKYSKLVYQQFFVKSYKRFQAIVFMKILYSAIFHLSNMEKIFIHLYNLFWVSNYDINYSGRIIRFSLICFLFWDSYLFKTIQLLVNGRFCESKKVRNRPNTNKNCDVIRHENNTNPALHCKTFTTRK